MKRFLVHFGLFPLLIIVLFSSIAAQGTESWHWMNPQPTGSLLTAIQFIDNDTGYAVGRSTIMKTTDGGENWEYKIPIPFEPCNGCQSLCFPEDAQTGYVVGSEGNILKTTDGGETWESQSSGTSCTLLDVHFPVDAQTGYAAGHSGTILKTTDGGATWQDQSLGITDKIAAIDFPVGDQTGYAIDDFHDYATIWKTTDGGSNWVSQGQITLFPSDCMHFPVDATTGYVAGANGKIYKTTDGGSNWVLLYDAPYAISHLWFTDNQTGYAGGYKELLKTTDGGTSWTVIPISEYCGFASGIHFPVNGQTGYIATAYGQIFKTTDSGATWADQRTSLLPDSTNAWWMTSIHSVGNTVYAVGSKGAIMKSTDDGCTWSVLPPLTGDSDMYRCVWSVDPQTTFIGGLLSPSGCAICKTTDGGSTWTFWGLYNYPNCIQFVDSQTGYCGWNNGVLKTTNCGETWGTLSGVATECQGLHFPVDDQIGYTVHTGGRICKTTDGGASWVEQSTPVSMKLCSVYFTDVNTGWATGWNGTLLRTTNGGATWSTQSSGLGNNYHLKSVCFSTSADTGYIATYSGYISVTTDGGSSWTPQSIGSSNFRSVCFKENSSVAYITGSNGAIMRFGDDYLGIETEEEQPLYFFQPSLSITPNPFMSCATVNGHEEERFVLYDISGRRVGRYRGDSIGEGLCSGVYIVVPEDNTLEPARIVKIR